MAKSIRPLGDKVVVRRESGERTTTTGVVIPEFLDPDWLYKGEMLFGEVVAVGPGKRNKKGGRDTMWGLEPGMRVAFSPRGNTKVKLGDDELTVIGRDAVTGIVEAAA